MYSLNLKLALCVLLCSSVSLAQVDSTLWHKAAEYQETGKYRNALKVYNEMLESDPKNIDLLKRRAATNWADYNVEDAFTDLYKAIQLDPDNFYAYYQRSNYYYALVKPNSAVKDLDQALRCSKNAEDSASVYLNRGSAFTQMRAFKKANEDFYKAYFYDTLDINVLNNLAITLDEIGRDEDCIAYLKRIIEIDPEFFGAWVNLGFQYSNAGNYKEALIYLDKAVELDPEEPYAWNNRGYAKYELGDHQGALKDINRSLKLYSSNSYAYRNRALVYQAQGKKEKACEDLRQALALKYTMRYGDDVKKNYEELCID